MFAFRESLQAARSVLRLFSLLKPYSKRYLRQSYWLAIAALLSLSLPYASSILVDEVYPSGDKDLLLAVVLLVFAVGFASSCVSVLRGAVSQLLVATASNAMASKFLAHSLSIPLRRIEATGAGTLYSRLSEARGALTGLARTFDTLASALLTLTVVPIIVLAINAPLALLAVVGPVLTGLISQISISRSRPVWRLAAEGGADAAAMFSESVAAVRTIKLVDGTPNIVAEFERLQHDVLDKQLSAIGLTTTFSVFSGLLKMVHIGVSTYVGWRLVMAGRLSVGDYIAFGAYIGMVTGPIGVVSSVFSDLQRSSVAVERFFQIFDEPSDLQLPLALRSSRRLKWSALFLATRRRRGYCEASVWRWESVSECSSAASRDAASHRWFV
jgi:ABC-type bacteriocin/lantibiotic exporter with double-glycine peptidase domain